MIKIKTYIALIITFITYQNLHAQINNGHASDCRHFVCGEQFLQNTFYTWTTHDQIIELKKTKTLLTKSVSSKGEYSIYDLSLRDSSLINNEFATILREPQFAKKRFAWINSWATVMGWDKEKYGDCLIKITLKDSAIVGKLDITNKTEPISFYFLSGKKLTKEEIQLYKNKIAAIYHINNYKGTRSAYKHKNRSKTAYNKSEREKVTKEYTNIPFREYVIVNENMINEFSFEDDNTISYIKNEIAFLDTLKLKIKNEVSVQPSTYCNVWKDCNCGIDKDMFEYLSLICFENDNYLYTQKRITKIQKTLMKILSKQKAN